MQGNPRGSLRRWGVLLSALGLGASLASPVAAQAVTYKKADDGARITAIKWLHKTEFDLTVQSPALGSTQKVRILVPRTWRTNSTRTWPTVYAFHGGHNSYVSWTNDTDMVKTAAAWDVMVVMPEGANGSYTNWYNYGKFGTPQWETWHTSEVRQLVERNFHAGGIRAAIGNSSGGGGAMIYAARHPGLFKSASSYSGVLSMLSPGIPALLLYTGFINANDAFAIWGDPVTARSNWVAHDPLSQLPRLRGVRLYVSAGTTGLPGPYDNRGKWAPWSIAYLSESQVGRASTDFVNEAKKLGIPLIDHLYGAGSHSWVYWTREYHADWPGVMKAIGARKF